MNNENYLEPLHAHEVDQNELEQLIAAHFGHSKAVSLQEIEYQHRDTPASTALTVTYDNQERLQGIHAGPGLKPDDLSTLRKSIHDALLTPAEPVIRRLVLFASVPMASHFRYKDIFQLRALPPEAPRPSFLSADHPLYLEFCFLGSADGLVRIQRQTRVGHELELVCVALLTHIKGSLGIAGRHHWVAPIAEDIAQTRSEYLQEMYTWPAGELDQKAFLSVDDLPPARFIPADEYYARRGISPDDELDLPDTFEDSVDRFFRLSRDRKDRFLRASFWFRHAQRAFSYSQSASFTALVSSIEALMGPTPPSEQCSECGKAKGPGPTKLFTEFVERYAPSPQISNADRRQLYALRSKLAHGGHLLHSDHGTWGGVLNPSYLSQWEDMSAMWQIVRIALVNWLQTQP